ncbi:SDR family NAD(P)-dependent oxidoreductase [Lacrimispora aerotolerans]|uniref:SDR family NAD(P)-dependent oxidoreductase n=1 Tax=Lacrimispora aerotolerans TaxID=36832 RepID=UPI00047E8C54|nr:SDR family oxidoreductase [Lacrimispora aerotolerans]
MNKAAVVIGGSGAIGSEICKRLAEENYHTYFTYLKNKDTASELEQAFPGYLHGISCNIRNHEEVELLIDRVKKECGRVDVLINCAGISGESLFVNKSIDEWTTVLETNLFSIFYSCRAVVPIMLEQYGGVIINVSSILGTFGIPGMEDYCSSKSAMIGFTQSLASEVARFGIRVNCISPGMIDTQMSKGAQKQIGKSVKKLIPCKEFGSAENVADLMVFLISEKASYITGENILIGGGLGRTLPVS